MIYVVATEVKRGKGGISTALAGLLESQQLQQAGVLVIESHRAGVSRLQSYKQARSALKQAGSGDIVWLHCGRWLSLFRKFLLARHARKNGAKILFHFHSVSLADYLSNPIVRILLKRIFRISSGLIVVSNYWRDLLKSNIKTELPPIFVMPNTIDGAFASVAIEQSLSLKSRHSLDSIDLLTMTRLVPGKNVDKVIEALRLLPNQFRLLIAGEGPEQSKLKEQVSKLNLDDRVQFLGWVNYADKINVLKRADIFVLPSSYDAFGMGFIEAMAVGLPVVGLRYRATEEIISDGEVGRLVDNTSAEALANAISECVENHEQWSKNAALRVLANYQSKTHIEAFLKFCSGLN